MAVNTFAANVNATKDTVNTQIAIVKETKTVQNQAYLAYQAFLAEQARLRAEQARLVAQRYAKYPGIGPRGRAGYSAGAEAGAFFLNFEKDKYGIYHARQETWQSYGGYTDFYDKVFDAATSMYSDNFKFSASGKDYVVWIWKGNYLNMGAGAEMGIYYKNGDFWSQYIWKAGEDEMRTKNRLTLDYVGTALPQYQGQNLFMYNPAVPQWWTTGFNSDVQGVQANDLAATGSITFSKEQQGLYDAFSTKYRGRSNLNFDDANRTVTIRW
jgi:hypothetical protein